MKFLLGFCSFLSGVLGIYSFVIFIRIIFSWAVMFVQRNRNYNFNAGYDQPEGPTFVETVDNILGKICDPYLNLFRGARGLRRSAVDFTPLLALVVLNLVKSILSIFSQTGEITIWIIIAVIIDGLWGSFVSLLLFILIVLMIIRLAVGRSNGYRATGAINTIDSILDGPVGFVYKLFYKGKQISDQKLVAVSLAFYGVLLIAGTWLVRLFCNFLITI